MAHSVQNDEEVLNTVYAKPSASTHWVIYEMGLS